MANQDSTVAISTILDALKVKADPAESSWSPTATPVGSIVTCGYDGNPEAVTVGMWSGGIVWVKVHGCQPLHFTEKEQCARPILSVKLPQLVDRVLLDEMNKTLARVRSMIVQALEMITDE